MGVMKRIKIVGVVSALSGLLLSCGGPLVGVTVVDERTALENQVLGSYQKLNEEVLLVASVRYINPQGKLVPRTAVPPKKLKAIRSLQRSAFNQDDIHQLKSAGIVGENNTGGLTLLSRDKIKQGEKAFVENLIREENEDRAVLMRRIIETNEKLTEQDLPKIRKTFAALNRDKARQGDLIQLDNGEWVPKSAR